MRISDWSSDVCSSDLNFYPRLELVVAPAIAVIDAKARLHVGNQFVFGHEVLDFRGDHRRASHAAARKDFCSDDRSEEHTSELQSLMRISYAVFCLKKKTKKMKYHSSSKAPILNNYATRHHIYITTK